MNIDELVKKAHENARLHGFWDGPQNLSEKIALIHSEASEALEVMRELWKCTDEGQLEVLKRDRMLDTGKPVGFPSELADIVIRVADLAGYLGIDLLCAVERKMAYNATRPYKHNKAF